LASVARANLDYVEVRYGQYLEDPRFVDESWALAVASYGFALEGDLVPG
jgi:2-oxoglutarate dehydrogenase complex dehydrogenase (E1) component-like enzyme